MFEQVEATTKRLEMTSMLVELIKETSREEIGEIVYLLQGKLYPDYLGIELGIAEKLLIKVIAETSGKSEESVDGDYKKSGDIGLTVEQLLKKKSQIALFTQPLTVDRVYGIFDKIARATGSGSVELKMRLLASLLNDASPLEGKFIARMAVGRLRLGVADMTVLDALALAYGGDKTAREPLERAYNLSSDLGYVARIVATEGIEGVRKFSVTIGRPIRPMLCERLSTAQDILEKLGGTGAVEYKYDGLRIQAHVTPASVHLFSRRLENITDQFPDVARLLQKNVKGNAIVEGECVAVDAHTGDMLPFQVISQRRGRKYDVEKMAEEIPVTVFLFDALYVDGRDLTLSSYLDRRRELASIVTLSEHVTIAQQFEVHEAQQLEALMEQAVSAGCEGLVAKNIGSESTYQAGGRGWLWIKYKRSYKAEIQDTFDLVPVGAFAGRGRRAGKYGALLMAVYNAEGDLFETLCKLGSGFNDEDLANLPKLLEPHLIHHAHPRVRSLMEPDFWFTPSLVLEVGADEITLSPLHTCGWNMIRQGSGLALRFPRFTGNWRNDKGPEDATSSRETVELYQRQLKKIDAEATG